MSDTDLAPPRRVSRRVKPEAAAPQPAANTASPAAAPSPGAPSRAAAAIPADIPLLTRKSRRSGQGAIDFTVPENLKKAGWDYEWKTTTYNARPVEDAEFAFVQSQGWRPVPAADMPGMCGPDYQGKTIERYGQRLYMRPLYLSAQAKEEDYKIAVEQKDDKLKASSAVPMPAKGMQSQLTDFKMHEEIGHIDQPRR